MGVGRKACVNHKTWMMFQNFVVVLRLFSLVRLFCDPMDCTPPGSFVHGILQARILEWVAIPFSRGASRSRDQTQVFSVSCIPDRFFTAEPLGWPMLGTSVAKEMIDDLMKQELFLKEGDKSIRSQGMDHYVSDGKSVV